METAKPIRHASATGCSRLPCTPKEPSIYSSRGLSRVARRFSFPSTGSERETAVKETPLSLLRLLAAGGVDFENVSVSAVIRRTVSRGSGEKGYTTRASFSLSVSAAKLESRIENLLFH